MRKKEWVQNLEAEILAASNKKFSWGVHDCALFACNCIVAMTDKDPAYFFRGKYNNEEAALQLIEIYSGGGLKECAEKITSELGFEEILPSFVQRGDVAIVDVNGNTALGIVDLGGLKVLIASESGITSRPLSAIIKAWRVD